MDEGSDINAEIKLSVMNQLVRMRQDLALLRMFPDLSSTLKFDKDETCGIAWAIDRHIATINTILTEVDKLI